MKKKYPPGEKVTVTIDRPLGSRVKSSEFRVEMWGAKCAVE